MSNLYGGGDISPSHFAIVVLDEAGRYLEASMGVAEKDTEKVRADLDPRDRIRVYPVPAATKDPADQMFRHWAVGSAVRTVFCMLDPDYTLWYAQEDYAFEAPGGAHKTGETGGLFKFSALDRSRTLVRLHAPGTLKYFSTGSGVSEKTALREQLIRDHGAPSLAFGADKHSDFYDAYALAVLAFVERQVFLGEMTLAQLREYERAVLLRTTPSWPTNVLARPWASVAHRLEARERNQRVAAALEAQKQAEKDAKAAEKAAKASAAAAKRKR